MWLMGCDGDAVDVDSRGLDGKWICGRSVYVVFVGDIAVVIRDCLLGSSTLSLYSVQRPSLRHNLQPLRVQSNRSPIECKVVSSTVSCKIANIEEAGMRLQYDGMGIGRCRCRS